MTSHGSWIDQDEIDQLVNSLGGGKSQKRPAPSREPEPVAQPEPIAQPEAVAQMEPIAPPEPVAEPTPEESIPDVEERSEMNTNEVEAFTYSLGTGELEMENQPDSLSTDSAASAPSASNIVKALTEARKRANRGGLLRGIKKGSSPLWPDFPPLEEEVVTPEVPQNVEQAVEPEVEIFAEEKSLPIRQRLAKFATQTVDRFEASSLTITDFSGYLLLQHGAEENMGTTVAATLVTDQLNRLSEAVGAPDLGSTQISLSDNRWLCLVEAKSATGGVLAQMQIPEPLDSGKTAQFRKDLEAVLAG